MKTYYLLKSDGMWVSGISKSSYDQTIETCDSESNAIWFNSLQDIEDYGFPGGHYELVTMLVI